jgi:hypothetical protein
VLESETNIFKTQSANTRECSVKKWHSYDTCNSRAVAATAVAAVTAAAVLAAAAAAALAANVSGVHILTQ